MRLLAAHAVLALLPLSANAEITMELMHTKPECAQPGKTSTWCTAEDTDKATKDSGMVARINSILEKFAIAKAKAGASPKVHIAYFSFSNKLVHEKLCEVGKLGIPMTIVLDNGSKGQADKVAACQKDPQKPNVKVSYLGGVRQPWRLHHNKFLVVDPGDGTDFSINFSSGNLSTYGTSLHLDHWVVATAPANSNLTRSHLCVIKGLDEAVKTADETGMYATGEADSKFDRQVVNAYIDTRGACFTKTGVIPTMESDKALEAEGIAPSYSPNKKNEVLKVFIRELERVTARQNAGEEMYIYIAIQHFLHRDVKAALVNAANAGVDVRLVMDDDVARGESEVPGVSKFYREELRGKGMEIRFAQTNAGARQMMHNKLAILSGERTFSGAGHYTTAAMKNNWENFYLVQNRKLVREYTTYFKELWEKSLDETGATGGVISAPEALHPKALELIGTP